MDALSPQLWVKDMRTSIDFYRNVLGFEIRGEVEDPPTHVSLTRGEASIMLAPIGNDFDGAWPAARVAAQRPASGGPVLFYVEAGDIEVDFQHARQQGAKIVDELGAKPWGQREFTVEDPDGILWAFWKQV